MKRILAIRLTQGLLFCRRRDLDHKPFARLELSLPKTFIFQHIFAFFFSFREEESLPITLHSIQFLLLAMEKSLTAVRESSAQFKEVTNISMRRLVARMGVYFVFVTFVYGKARSAYRAAGFDICM